MVRAAHVGGERRVRRVPGAADVRGAGAVIDARPAAARSIAACTGARSSRSTASQRAPAPSRGGGAAGAMPGDDVSRPARQQIEQMAAGEPGGAGDENRPSSRRRRAH